MTSSVDAALRSSSEASCKCSGDGTLPEADRSRGGADERSACEPPTTGADGKARISAVAGPRSSSASAPELAVRCTPPPPNLVVVVTRCGDEVVGLTAAVAAAAAAGADGLGTAAGLRLLGGADNDAAAAGLSRAPSLLVVLLSAGCGSSFRNPLAVLSSSVKSPSASSRRDPAW